MHSPESAHSLNIAYFAGSGSWVNPSVPNPFSQYFFNCATTGNGQYSITAQINTQGLTLSPGQTYAFALY
jgi:hypothetical protein